MANPAVKPSPLGRGLSALLGDVDTSYNAGEKTSVVQASVEKSELQKIPTGWLQSGQFQPRRYFEEGAMKELAASMQERGILEPLIVRPFKNEKNRYEIVAGERRWRAAQLAGLHNVPVLVKNLSDREAMEFGIIENIQREELSPLEEAEGYKRLIEEFGHTQDALSKIVGKSRPYITNMMRLLGLPEGVKDMLLEGKITVGHARAVVVADNPMKLALEIVKKGLNVRQAETLAKKSQENPQIHKKHSSTEQRNADTLALEKEIERVIGLKIKIAPKGKSGTMTIYYTDLDQLDDIIRKLRS